MTARKISKAAALHALSGDVLPKLRKRPQIYRIWKYKKGLFLCFYGINANGLINSAKGRKKAYLLPACLELKKY